MIISDIGGDKRIILDNGYFGRRATCLGRAGWTRLRIALRFCLSDSGGNVTSTYFGIGLCCGATFKGASGPQPAHGLYFELYGNSATFTRSTTPTRYEQSFVATTCYKNGVASTYGVADLENSTMYMGANDSLRTVLLCDITRSGTTYTVTQFRNTSTACTDVSQATFDSVARMGEPVLTNHGYNTGTTITVNEPTDGIFDHVNVAWNHDDPVIKISDLKVVRF